MSEELEGITIGKYRLTHFPMQQENEPESYWLEHEDGEGMQVWVSEMQKIIEKLWEQF